MIRGNGGERKTTCGEAGIKYEPRTEESLLAWNPTPHTCIAADSFKDATKKPLHPNFPVKCTFKANKKKNQRQKSNKRPKTLHHHQTSFSHYLQEMQHCNAWINSTYKWASVTLLGREGTLPCSYLWTCSLTSSFTSFAHIWLRSSFWNHITLPLHRHTVKIFLSSAVFNQWYLARSAGHRARHWLQEKKLCIHLSPFKHTGISW